MSSALFRYISKRSPPSSSITYRWDTSCSTHYRINPIAFLLSFFQSSSLFLIGLKTLHSKWSYRSLQNSVSSIDGFQIGRHQQDYETNIDFWRTSCFIRLEAKYQKPHRHQISPGTGEPFWMSVFSGDLKRSLSGCLSLSLSHLTYFTILMEKEPLLIDQVMMRLKEYGRKSLSPILVLSVSLSSTTPITKTIERSTEENSWAFNAQSKREIYQIQAWVLEFKMAEHDARSRLPHKWGNSNKFSM